MVVSRRVGSALGDVQGETSVHRSSPPHIPIAADLALVPGPSQNLPRAEAWAKSCSLAIGSCCTLCWDERVEDLGIGQAEVEPAKGQPGPGQKDLHSDEGCPGTDQLTAASQPL